MGEELEGNISKNYYSSPFPPQKIEVVHRWTFKLSRKPEVRTRQRRQTCQLSLEGLEGMRQLKGTNTACPTEHQAVKLFFLLTATTTTRIIITAMANLIFIQHLIQSNLHFLSTSRGLDMSLDNGSKGTGKGNTFLPSGLKDL